MNKQFRTMQDVLTERYMLHENQDVNMIKAFAKNMGSFEEFKKNPKTKQLMGILAKKGKAIKGLEGKIMSAIKKNTIKASSINSSEYDKSTKAVENYLGKLKGNEKINKSIVANIMVLVASLKKEGDVNSNIKDMLKQSLTANVAGEIISVVVFVLIFNLVLMIIVAITGLNGWIVWFLLICLYYSAVAYVNG